jgi:putative PIN family toxin of toxin-antitoxin system
MKIITAFVDSDVVLSSLISTTSAAHLLLNSSLKAIILTVSNFSVEELKEVIKRGKLKVKPASLNKLLEKIKIVFLDEKIEAVKINYGNFVFDVDDAHIAAGAAAAKANFLITYNKRHYCLEKIKRDLNLIVFTPAEFLQYLRSQNFFE